MQALKPAWAFKKVDFFPPSDFHSFFLESANSLGSFISSHPPKGLQILPTSLRCVHAAGFSRKGQQSLPFVAPLLSVRNPTSEWPITLIISSHPAPKLKKVAKQRVWFGFKSKQNEHHVGADILPPPHTHTHTNVTNRCFWKAATLLQVCFPT